MAIKRRKEMIDMGKAHGISGGGLESRQTVQTRNPKVEPTSHSVSMNRPSMIGLQHWQNDAKGALYNKIAASNPVGPTPMTPDMCKPGGGRTILKSGSQSSTPSPRPMGGGRSLFK